MSTALVETEQGEEQDRDVVLALSDVEKNRLERCEATINNFSEHLVKTGKALHEILEARLYRMEYQSFDEYCQGRWGFKRSWAYSLVKRYETYKNLDSNSEFKPSADSLSITVISEIKDPEKQVQVWDRACAKAKEEKALESGENDRVSPDPEIVTRAVNRSLGSQRAREAQVEKEQRRSRPRPASKDTNGEKQKHTAEFKELHGYIGKMVRLSDQIAKESGGHNTLSKSVVSGLGKLKDRVTAWQESKAK